jgi:hypothetical protein
MDTVRWTGAGLLALALVLLLGTVFGDLGIEAESAAAMPAEVGAVHERTPWIVVAQAVQVATAPVAVFAGVGLYLPLRRTRPGLGLAGLVLLTIGGLVLALQGLVGMSMVMASTQYATGELVTAQSEYLVGVVLALAAMHWGTWLSGWALLGLAVAALGSGLALGTRVLPRWTGWVALAGGALTLLAPLTLPLTMWLFFFVWLLGALVLLVWMVAAGLVLLFRAPHPEPSVGGAAAPTVA